MPTKLFSNEIQTFNTVAAKENSCAPCLSQFSPVKIPLAYFPKKNFVFVICSMFHVPYIDKMYILGICMTLIIQ